MPPQYYAYKEGFANLNKCTDCGIIGLYEDMHEVEPCIKCGGKVKNTKPGKWDKKLNKWMVREGVKKEQKFYEKDMRIDFY